MLKIHDYVRKTGNGKGYVKAKTGQVNYNYFIINVDVLWIGEN